MVPDLSKKDEIFGTSKCGTQAFVCLGQDKCYKMHISKRWTECTTNFKVQSKQMKDKNEAVKIIQEQTMFCII